MGSRDSASHGAWSSGPWLGPTRPSNICRETRKLSPSEAKKGSRVTGSAEPAKTNLSPPPPESRLLSAQPANAVAASVAATAPNTAGRIDVNRTCHLTINRPDPCPSKILGTLLRGERRRPRSPAPRRSQKRSEERCVGKE